MLSHYSKIKKARGAAADPLEEQVSCFVRDRVATLKSVQGNTVEDPPLT